MGILNALSDYAGGIPGVGLAARGLGAGGSALSAGGAAAGWAVVGAAQETIKDAGFWLFIVGLFYSWIIKAILLPIIFSNYETANLIFNIIIAIFACFFVFKGRGWLFLTLFIIWFWPYKQTTNLGVLIVFGLIIISYVVSLKFMGKEIGHELVSWLVILFFYLERGLIPGLMGLVNLPVSNLLTSILWYFPWWAVLGLYLTKKETFIISVLKVGTFFIIAATMVVALAPNLSSQEIKTTVPGLGEITTGTGPLTKGENPFISTTRCLWQDPTHLTECVEKKQVESKCNYLKNKGVPDAQNEEYQNCLKAAKGEAPALVATGGIDPTATEVTKIEFDKTEGFSEEIYRTRFPLPFKMTVESPRRELEISIDCLFKKGEELVPGIASPATFKIEGKPPAKNIICTPAADLSAGRWKVELTAEAANLQTTTIVRRLFIGQKTDDEKDFYKREYTLPGGTFGPISAKEFARVNFWFGEPTTNPLIEFDDNPLFIANVENVGQGMITEIKKVEINLIPGLIPSAECMMVYEENKMTRTDLSLTGVQQTKPWPLEACYLQVSQELRDPERYFREKFLNRDFEGKIEYSYRIKKDFEITVTPLEQVMPR